MHQRPRRAQRVVNYTEQEDAAVDASELLGDDVSAADVRGASDRLQSRLGGKVGEATRGARRRVTRVGPASGALGETERGADAESDAQRDAERDAQRDAERDARRDASRVAGAETDVCKHVYRAYRKAADGADGALGAGYGMNGSLGAPSMCAVLRALRVGPGTTFVDIGAAEGRALVCAEMLGAREVVGYELPGPAEIHKHIFEAVRHRLRHDPRRTARVGYESRDVRSVSELPEGTTAVYCFWDGFHPADQDHILGLIGKCRTVRSACVFVTRKRPAWTTESVRERLEHLEQHGRRLETETIGVGMFGSDEKKTAIVVRFVS